MKMIEIVSKHLPGEYGDRPPDPCFCFFLFLYCDGNPFPPQKKKQPTNKKRPQEFEAGKGTALSDMPNVVERLSKVTRVAPVVGQLYNLFYGGVGKVRCACRAEFSRNINNTARVLLYTCITSSTSILLQFHRIAIYPSFTGLRDRANL